MLVKFDSRSGNLTMFGDVALQLLNLMGHSGTIPGAIRAFDIPAALARLQHGLDALPPGAPIEKEGLPQVSLHQRAYPFVQFLQRAAASGFDVLWDQA